MQAPAPVVTGDAPGQQISLEDVQKYIRANNLSWTAGYTSMSNASFGVQGEYHGLISDPVPDFLASDSSGSDSRNYIDPADLPAAFDWRDNGGDWTTPVKDQGKCGSCWAFAVTGAFESYWEITSGDPSLNPDFSEQYLVSCNNDGYGCQGGRINALKYLVATPGAGGGVGTVLETDFPYESITGSSVPCRDLSSYRRFRTREGTTWRHIEDMSGIPSSDKIKSTVYQYGPVVASMHMSNEVSWYYRSGIIEEPVDFTSQQTNHGVIIVGWGHDPVKNRDYWICKNSYGPGWGENGWFRIYVNNYYVGTDAAYLEFTDTRPGSADLSSNPPGAMITLDGTATGQVTDTRLTGIPGGYHTILLQKDGFQEYRATVYIHPGSSRSVQATLARNRQSTISVSSVPDNAAIWLDGADTGMHTNAVIGVTPGLHTVRVEKPGYIAQARGVSASEGSDTAAMFTLDPVVVPVVTTAVPTAVPTKTNTPTVSPTATPVKPVFTPTPTRQAEAAMGAYPRTGAPPVRVQFADLSSGNPAQWFWSFGDGTFSEEKNPLHTYAEEGEYAVKLVTGTGTGSRSVENLNYVVVRSDLPPAPEPTAVPVYTPVPTPIPTPTPAVQPTATPGIPGPLKAGFTAGPRTGQFPMTVAFSDGSSGNPLRWTWAFGDGAFSDEKNPTHTFSEPGEYSVRLTVQGQDGSSTVEKARYIVVGEW